MPKIISIKVENILGCKSFELEPNGNGVTIGGKNGQGKSSAISALIMALAGKDKMPEKPVRDGEEWGSVEITLDEAKVQLEVRSDRHAKLRVYDQDDRAFSSPQAVLNALFSDLSFDPGEFKQLPSDKRTQTLLNLVGLDLSGIDAERALFYEDRRDVNRDIKNLEGKLSGSRVDEKLADQAPDLSDLIAQRTAAAENNSKIDRLEDAIAMLQDDISKVENRLKALMQERTDLTDKMERFKREFEKAEVISTEALDQQISEAQAVSQRIAENNKLKARAAELAELKKTSEALSEKIRACDESKSKALEQANFPLPGLSFGDSGITYNGIPFDQISESQQWEVSTAIAFSLNPQGIVFMRQSGGLDKDSRDAVRQRAADSGVQLFMEVVDDQDDVEILIHEGEVAENRLQLTESDLTI